MNNRLLILLILLSGLMAAIPVPKKINKPNYFLFQLLRSDNLLESMRKRGMSRAQMQEVILADKEINESIIRDFATNFTFCPVYFFYSEHLDFVIKQQWDSVTFYDNDYREGRKKIKLNQISGYYIAEVNYPPPQEFPELDSQSHNRPPLELLSGDEPFTSSRDYGIRLYNESYQLLRSKLVFTNGTLYQKGNPFKKDDLRYEFTGAAKFQRKLEKYFAEPTKDE